MVQHDFKMKLITSIINVMMTTSILFLHLTSSQPCTNPIPNLDLDKMLRGVDISTIDQFSIVKAAVETPKENIFAFTCNDDQIVWDETYTNKYNYPDQIQRDVTANTKRSHIKNVNIIKTDQTIKQTRALEASILYQAFVSLFSASYKKIQKDIKNKSKVVADFTLRWQNIVFHVDKTDLSSKAKSYIKNDLSGSFESNVDAYVRFIDMFGTHFREDGIFGGAVKKYMEINTAYEYEINKYSAQYFVTIMGNNQIAKVSPNIKNNVYEEEYYYGGDDKLKTPKEYTKWRGSTKQTPWFYSTKLSPIYGLMKDEKMRKEIKKAVDFYLVKKVAIQYFEKYVIYEKLPKQYINKMIIKFITDHEISKLSNIDLIVNQVDYEANAPDVFRRQARICVLVAGACSNNKGKGLEKSGQCFDWNRRMNPYYYINSGIGKSNRCQLNWMYDFIDKKPKYAPKINICMRYESTGATLCFGRRKGQDCGNQVAYVDNPTSYTGHCKLSWKFQAPDDSPIWLKSGEFCFYWRSDRKPSNCGGGIAQQVCASAGNWTPYFKLRTRGVPNEGCYISFGWRTLNHVMRYRTFNSGKILRGNFDHL